MPEYNVGILGGTGAVGQKFIRLLQGHPWFKISVLGASSRSAGKPYSVAANWIESVEMPSEVRDFVVKECDPMHFSEVDFVFSGLDSSVAGDVELAFATAGIPVISNAKNYRTDPSVPLLIPEVNPDHVKLIDTQTFTSDRSGWIVTNPNCVAVPLTTSLKPLHDQYGIKSVIVTSMQAISGAGYPGVPSLDILGNVIPHINGEESKIVEEPLKMLGALKNGELTHASFPVQATATRVPVINGHLLSVAVGLNDKPASEEDVIELYKSWESPIKDLDLPSAPDFPIYYHDNPFYPQPRLHADSEKGMRTSVGKMRKSNVLDISYVAMAHNTVRGAAGGAILNAELLVRKEYL